ncbi:uncharacterized protein LOC132251920 [Alligator mississippiensis]|uniref:uncharacterized protein LOC132251920 n=1 Tax=Alligator mississippiensis TaxID=8496 RepID=UPI0028778F46|nr:uncharacterized protein LOC132251920 [Alligator mississippiensis]
MQGTTGQAAYLLLPANREKQASNTEPLGACLNTDCRGASNAALPQGNRASPAAWSARRVSFSRWIGAARLPTAVSRFLPPSLRQGPPPGARHYARQSGEWRERPLADRKLGGSGNGPLSGQREASGGVRQGPVPDPVLSNRGERDLGKGASSELARSAGHRKMRPGVTAKADRGHLRKDLATERTTAPPPASTLRPRLASWAPLRPPHLPRHTRSGHREGQPGGGAARRVPRGRRGSRGQAFSLQKRDAGGRTC